MKIVIDHNIPYINGVFEPYADVHYLPGKSITPKMVKDADALIIRTRTRCTRELLEGSSVRFIASATIGFDHIDTRYCKEAGITWANSPGCNSGSVEQYVTAALFTLAQQQNTVLKGKTIGIVGVGNVGVKVERVARILGMHVLLNDPPREREEGPENFVPLDDILRQADIITLHVPLNRTGKDCTLHMADDSFFNRLKRSPWFINTCRGEVAEPHVLKTAIRHKQVSATVIDCWGNEPVIDRELLDLATIATPHIAGYSRDGKANGTIMGVQAVSRFFKLGIDQWQPGAIEPPGKQIIEIKDARQKTAEQLLADAVLSTYPIMHDDQQLRQTPLAFEQLRDNYAIRREYPAYRIAGDFPAEIEHKLRQLGFVFSS